MSCESFSSIIVIKKIIFLKFFYKLKNHFFLLFRPEVVHTTCECLKQLLSDTKISLMIKNKFIKNNEEKEDDEEDKNSEIIDSGDFANERYKLLLPFFLEKARNKVRKLLYFVLCILLTCINIMCKNQNTNMNINLINVHRFSNPSFMVLNVKYNGIYTDKQTHRQKNTPNV